MIRRVFRKFQKKFMIFSEEPHSVELVFESREDAEVWISWYVHSGEQEAKYYSDRHRSNPGTDFKMFLRGEDYRCPFCKSTNVKQRGMIIEHACELSSGVIQCIDCGEKYIWSH